MFMINKKRLPVKNGDSWERFSPPHVVWGTLAGEGTVSCNESFNVLDIDDNFDEMSRVDLAIISV